MYACTVVGVVVVVVERLLRGQKEKGNKCEQMLMKRGINACKNVFAVVNPSSRTFSL